MTLLQKQIFIAVLLIASAVAFRYYIMQPGPAPGPVASKDKSRPSAGASKRERAEFQSDSSDAGTAETAVDHAKKHMDASYVCPMHPNIVSKEPGTCPICGMDLVLVEAGGEAETVTVAPGTINMLGVRTEQVKRRTLYRRIDSVGYVAFDENHIRSVSLRVEGWIDRLNVKNVGTRVKRGEPLFEIYSPMLVNAQEEFVTALHSGSEDLIAASMGRLIALGLTQEQVQELERTQKVAQTVQFSAPQDGIVSDLKVREGGFVMPAAPIVDLVDLSTVWLIVDIFERQADWVKVGNKAEAVLAFIPDKTWEGTVDYIYPSLDPKTRSLQVRIRFDNPDEALKPNMYADVKIFAAPKRDALSVPREALIRTGDGDRVILALGEGRFKPAAVRPGMETTDRVEILEGIEEGEDVVVSSQFLIDSESSLRAALMRMSGI
jgi:Cu(I)/Ag(I) efflux system membrane fusion protein